MHKDIPHDCKMPNGSGRYSARPPGTKLRVVGGCRPAGPPSFSAAQRFRAKESFDRAGPGSYDIAKADDQLAHRRKRGLCLSKIEPYHYLGGSSLIGSPGFTMVGNNVMFDEAYFVMGQNLTTK